MATATRTAKITIHLTLSEREAKFLRDFTQNCLDGDPAAESMEVREARESIFNAIDTGLKKRK